MRLLMLFCISAIFIAFATQAQAQFMANYKPATPSRHKSGHHRSFKGPFVLDPA
ncbi:unnamed protein product [Phyllotreta striolata]|uniref:Uncharacterized protein n=1 Tax=Phyllotreta striolata TaxID=444603 RepID=A0A9N9TW50_PHYSR|nr:unnamed protein product [Phyllotreta striolata]